MGIKNYKNIKFPDVKELMNDPLKTLEMQIGFLAGTMIGILGADICIILLVDMSVWIKVFTAIGGICVLGTLALGLKQSLSARKNYVETLAEMKKINEESLKTIDSFNNKENTEKEVKKDDE
jgi:hypothetical protein